MQGGLWGEPRGDRGGELPYPSIKWLMDNSPAYGKFISRILKNIENNLKKGKKIYKGDGDV